MSETLVAWSRHWLDCSNFIVLCLQRGAGAHVHARTACMKSRRYAPFILERHGGEWPTSRASYFSPGGQNPIAH